MFGRAARAASTSAAEALYGIGAVALLVFEGLGVEKVRANVPPNTVPSPTETVTSCCSLPATLPAPGATVRVAAHVGAQGAPAGCESVIVPLPSAAIVV